MFNNSLKKEALRIHEETLQNYDRSYEVMEKLCEQLYESRCKAIDLIKLVQSVVNSIANTPKEFDTEFGKIGKELTKFSGTKEYAKKVYDESLKAGMNIAGGVAAGVGVASMAPTAMMSIATTFGTASTGTAISSLSGVAAQKAAVAWIGRTFASFAVKEGAGMAVGKVFLALAGPIGTGITAASTGFALLSLTNKNRELADEAVSKAKEIAKAREVLDETSEEIRSLKLKTNLLYYDMNKQRDKIAGYMNVDYMSLVDVDKYFLGTLVNNTLSLSALLNETVE